MGTNGNAGSIEASDDIRSTKTRDDIRAAKTRDDIRSIKPNDDLFATETRDDIRGMETRDDARATTHEPYTSQYDWIILLSTNYYSFTAVKGNATENIFLR